MSSSRCRRAGKRGAETASPRPGTGPSTGSVGSVDRIAIRDRVVASTHAGALELGARYWAELARSTRGLVRARERGEEVELVLVGVLTLLRFGSAETSCDERQVECRFPIRGGLLAVRPGGSLAIAQLSEPVPQLELFVTEYEPRLAIGRWRPLRGILYSTLQVPLHRAVSRRFLARAAGGQG